MLYRIERKKNYIQTIIGLLDHFLIVTNNLSNLIKQYNSKFYNEVFVSRENFFYSGKLTVITVLFMGV